MKEFRRYTGWNRENGDKCLFHFWNENRVEGIEGNGIPSYEGEEGYDELLEEILWFDSHGIRERCDEHTRERIAGFSKQEVEEYATILAQIEGEISDYFVNTSKEKTVLTFRTPLGRYSMINQGIYERSKGNLWNVYIEGVAKDGFYFAGKMVSKFKDPKNLFEAWIARLEDIKTL